MIELSGLTKRYGSTLAVDDLSFQVLVGGTGGRDSPEVAALLLGAWAVGVLTVGAIALHRRDP